jgi:hypothetical protein
MTRPTLATLRPYLPPPADLSRLSDGELAAWCAKMAHRLRDSGLDNTCRLLMEAAERLRGPEPECPLCGLPHPSRNPYCFCPQEATNG